jgi:chorismate mutase
MKVVAIRGAITVERNDAVEILTATDELVRELMTRNRLPAEDMISCVFTMTPDLNAEFPAVAARELGLSRVPLLCAQEIAVPRALPRVIRVLVHANVDDEQPARHVYLREAATLRQDLEGAQ